MIGFTQTTPSVNYHHTPGKIGSYSKLDCGESVGDFQDRDPRENFVSYGSNQVILGHDPSKDYSFMHRFQSGDEKVVSKEWATADGRYEELEVRQNGSKTTACLTVSNGTTYESYKADPLTAAALMTTVNTEFEERWNISK